MEHAVNLGRYFAIRFSCVRFKRIGRTQYGEPGMEPVKSTADCTAYRLVYLNLHFFKKIRPRSAARYSCTSISQPVSLLNLA
eukprot:SAG31_NODE_1450_length_8307_cov_3.676657_12_plen_82_part_00